MYNDHDVVLPACLPCNGRRKTVYQTQTLYGKNVFTIPLSKENTLQNYKPLFCSIMGSRRIGELIRYQLEN